MCLINIYLYNPSFILSPFFPPTQRVASKKGQHKVFGTSKSAYCEGLCTQWEPLLPPPYPYGENVSGRKIPLPMHSLRLLLFLSLRLCVKRSLWSSPRRDKALLALFCAERGGKKKEKKPLLLHQFLLPGERQQTLCTKSGGTVIPPDQSLLVTREKEEEYKSFP